MGAPKNSAPVAEIVRFWRGEAIARAKISRFRLPGVRDPGGAEFLGVPLCGDDAQFDAVGVEDGLGVGDAAAGERGPGEAQRARWQWRARMTPGVEAEVMVVTVRGEEAGAG